MAKDCQRRTRRLLLDVPICIAGGLGATLMAARFILVLKENLQANEDGLRGVIMLAGILTAASIIIVLACAAAGAVIGCVLQALFARRPVAYLRASGHR